MCSHILPGPSRERSRGFDSERICESQIDYFVMAITSAKATFWHYRLPTNSSTAAVLSESDCNGEWEKKMMMRALFLRVAIGTCAAISLGVFAANAQLVKPKYPGEIAAASNHIAQRNEDCRRQAREQHLHLVKRYRFMRDCKRQ
jgi:hypothetical protein